MMNMKQGINWYKMYVVGMKGKLNETIEMSALWSSKGIHCSRLHKDNVPCFNCHYLKQSNAQHSGHMGQHFSN